MLKNLTGGSSINYGANLPTNDSSFDGTMFYKNAGTNQGLYIYGFVQDANLAVVGDQPAQSWTQVQSPGLYVSLLGDTMSGNLSMANNSLVISSNNFSVVNATAPMSFLSGNDFVWKKTALAGGNEVMRLTSNGVLQIMQSGSAQTVWHSGNDGAGSGLDADLLDGQSSAYFQNASNINTGTLDTARLQFTPVQQGGVGGQGSNKVYIGWAAAGRLNLQVDSTNFSDTWPININGNAVNANTANSATNATNANEAVNARYIRRGGAADGAPMRFNYEGKDGQPQWLWGALDNGVNEVYNPSNFNVKSAITATEASYSQTLRNKGEVSGTPMFFSWVDKPGMPPWVWGGSDGSNMFVYNPAQFSVAFATNSTTATNATKLYQNGVTSAPLMTFNWSNPGGQPAWVWGANDPGTSINVYNPSTFSVAYATNAGYAASAGSAANAGSVAWTNVSGRPTTVSAFVNDSGYTTVAAADNAYLSRATDTWIKSSDGWNRFFFKTATNNNNTCFGTGNSYEFYASDSTTQIFSIDGLGNVIAKANITAYSDITLKTKIQTITTPLDKVMKLNGVTFSFISNDMRGTGLIAQDVQAVIPEAVLVDKDGLLSVAYGNLVGLLVESIKELNLKVDKLQNEVLTLRGKNDN